MSLNTEWIAAGLGVFFLLAAGIKGVMGAAHRRKMANRKAAEASGGTEDSPVQLYNPFGNQTAADGNAGAEAASTADGGVAAVAAADSAGDEEAQDEDVYLWE